MPARPPAVTVRLGATAACAGQDTIEAVEVVVGSDGDDTIGSDGATKHAPERTAHARGRAEPTELKCGTERGTGAESKQ